MAALASVALPFVEDLRVPVVLSIANSSGGPITHFKEDSQQQIPACTLLSQVQAIYDCDSKC
jgi:hypothetical protein